MADLYAKPYEVVETGYNPQQSQQDSQQSEMEAYLSSLPPQERQAAIERINAPLSGEELAMMANNDRSFIPTIEQFAEIEKFHKNHEISFLDGIGKIAEGGEQVMADLSNAVGSFIDSPLDSTKKMPATAVEAFAQGTRNFYGMLAQSQNPDSILFGVKDFLNGTGTIEDRYNQYIRALNFNRDSADIASGKTTLVMDKDMINPEITQAMSYIADPTLFVPFGKIASTGLRAVGLGEKLMLAGAKATAIKNGVIGGAIKWGAGQPLEFLGGAVRNTIDYGLEKGGQAFEATTGISGKEFAQTARMSGVGFSVSGIAGYAVPYASTISDAYIAGSSARGFGEALTLLGDTMKRSPFGRGINSWAAESLAQAEKNGVKLSPHAKGLLNVLNAVDPLFGYAGAVIEGSSHGIMIGGALGYASGGEEGMYHGMGAGMALGGVGGLAGKTVADVTGGTAVARRAVQAKMVIEGLKETNKEKAMFFQAMQKATEARGQDVDLVNGIIAGIDKVAPNFEFHAMTPEQFAIEGIRKGYDPSTGKFMEMSAIDHEFGGDRLSKSKAMYILRSVGGDFVGDSKSFLDALKRASARDSANPNKPASNIPSNLRKYIDVAKTFEKLSKTQQDAILKEIDGQKSFADSIGGKTKLREHYDALSWSEAWTDSLVKKFETDREGARKDIVDMLAQETKKNGELTKKGRALIDKLRAEGFLDREGKLLRERNLLQADMTMADFAMTKGGVIRRESDGKTHMYINLNRMGDETFPHELYHTIMRESPMKKHFTDSIVQKLLGVFDENGKMIREGEVNIDQARKFFQKYIDLTSRNEDGTLNITKADETMKLVNEAIEEYKSVGKNKKISDKARGLLEHYTEEFGAYYFSHWLMGRNRNTLFFGGELKGIEGLVERTKDAFLDFWQTKVSKANPEFDFSKGLNASFDRSEGLGRISSMDYFMRDMVRAASNANREVFRPDSMSIDNLRDFERSNGLRNLTGVDNNRRLNPREQVTQNIRLGKEAHKILTGLDKNLRTSKDTIDENGKSVITGRLSEAELDALVKGGIVPRAWADKVNQGYAMLDGTVSNVFSAGYLGKTEQTTDASYPRLTGKDVSFKNRKAVLFDVETKIKADGTFYTLFHTLDLAVIEQRGNHLWQNIDYRNLWNGDRSAMEADFFRYISNASKASTDNAKLDSAALLEKGDGLGAKRRDVLQQMAGMALQTGDAYKHQPIAVIPEGIRHSVTTFNIDGLTMPRVESGSRYDINMGNAHKFIRENWQPDDMVQEATPNGKVFTHDSGFKFTQDANGRVKSYDNSGMLVGVFNSIKEATTASKNIYEKAQENIRKIAEVAKKKERESRRNLQPLDDATYEEAFQIGDIFKTRRMQEIIGNSKLVRQTFDEFLSQRVEQLNSGKNEQEKGAILERLFNSEFKELIELESELKKVYDTFNLEKDSLAQQEQEIIGKIVELGQEKKRLQQFSDSDSRVDVGILEMYERIYKRKEEVNKRMSEIANKMHSEGINDLNSHYYITKSLLEKFNETGKLSEEAIKFAITPQLIKEYEANFETGKAVTFLANHGTPNHELMVSKTFNMAFLGRNTGSMSAFNATFFAGSKDTSMQYVGTPIPKTWFKDFLEARKYYVNNFSPELKAKLESMISSDTSKGVIQKVMYLMNNAHIEFPDDFKLKDTGRKTKKGEPYIAPQPETQLGYDIDGFLDRVLGAANDEGAVFGGVETYWKEVGREPYLLRNIVKMDNPLVHEYAKADFRDETFASVIKRAKEAGHDGVIFKNTRDGGGLDTIFASFAKNEDNKIFTLETSEDTRFAPRGVDEAGNKVKGGSEIEGRKYQPTEDDMYRGGRTYNQNSKKWKSGFIGLWAEQNPERLKGYNIEFFQKEAGAYRIRLQDNSVKGRTVDVGHITAVVSGDTATISTKIADEYQGNKLSYALYSEMAERLRAMGIRRVDGQIVNRDGVPIRVRERIIGDTRDYFSGKPIDQIEGAIRIREKQEQFGNMAGVDVYNTLDPKAHYQPTEGEHPWTTEIARAQRDLPEDAMKMAQRQLGGGDIGFAIEHAGDILHRTYEYVAVNNGFGYNTVWDKVNKVLRAVQGLQKEGFWEVEERNYPYTLQYSRGGTGKTWEEHKQVIKDVLNNFAKEHEKLPAYNDLQKTVKTINTSLGRLDFSTAEMELLKLRRKLRSQESWNQYASEGIPDSKPNTMRQMPDEGDALVQNGFEKSELNEKLIASGHIVLGFDERELAGKAVVINNPDTMMTGTLETPSGRILAEGEGGLNFVSKFGDIWANSKEAKARTTANNLKKAQKENGGVAYLSLTRGSFENALNSHTGAKAGMGILEYFVEQGYISLEEFRNALKDSGRKYGIDFNATQSAKAIHAEIASKFFGVSDSTFERRGDFVKDVITHLAENGESGHKNIEKISNALGANRLGRKIQFAPTGIREAIGLMLSDKRANVDPSHVYAYIEITGNISVEKTENGHKSYPWHIVQRDENGNKIRPRMLIPDKTNYVTDVFLNKNKEEVPRKKGATKLGSNQVGEAYGYVKEASMIPEGKERLKWQPAEGRIESVHEDNFNIDSSKAETEALKIAKDSGINILRGKTLSQVYIDKTDIVRGGLWTEIDGNKFSFDIVVDKNSRKKGIGSMLIKEALIEFNSLNEDGSLVLDIDVTSNEMKRLLEKNGFVVTGKEGGHIFMTKSKHQPAEGWRDWQSERTSVGSVIKNTAGYVIMVQKDKFKVYNPYKVMIGIYDSEEQAKRRVQKDEPRR